MTKIEHIKDKTDEIIEDIMSNEVFESCPDLIFKIRLAVEEIVVNIVGYAYKNNNQDGYIKYEVKENNNTITITLCDGGIPFNPLAQKDPDVTLPVGERNIGGLGIYLAKKLMDEVTYKYENEENVLTIKKKK